MNTNDKQLSLFLKKISMQELVIEIIENGRSGFIPALVSVEPIPIEFLLEEVSHRLSQKFDSADSFLDNILEPDSQWLDAETQAVFRHAVKIKAIEARRR